jgi:hypothetical protein
MHKKYFVSDIYVKMKKTDNVMVLYTYKEFEFIKVYNWRLKFYTFLDKKIDIIFIS